MASSNEVSEKVNKVLVDALGVAEDEIKPSATLQSDLGAESIDFLDIAFRIEREFGIKIPRGELFSERVFELCADRARRRGDCRGPRGTALADALRGFDGTRT